MKFMHASPCVTIRTQLHAMRLWTWTADTSGVNLNNILVIRDDVDEFLLFRRLDTALMMINKNAEPERKIKWDELCCVLFAAIQWIWVARMNDDDDDCVRERIYQFVCNVEKFMSCESLANERTKQISKHWLIQRELSGLANGAAAQRTYIVSFTRICHTLTDMYTFVFNENETAHGRYKVWMYRLWLTTVDLHCHTNWS